MFIFLFILIPCLTNVHFDLMTEKRGNPDLPRVPRATDPTDPALSWTGSGRRAPAKETGTRDRRLPLAGPWVPVLAPGPGADFGTRGPAGPQGGREGPAQVSGLCARGAGAWKPREGRYCYTVTSLINMLLTLSLSFLGS